MLKYLVKIGRESTNYHLTCMNFMVYFRTKIIIAENTGSLAKTKYFLRLHRVPFFFFSFFLKRSSRCTPGIEIKPRHALPAVPDGAEPIVSTYCDTCGSHTSLHRYGSTSMLSVRCSCGQHTIHKVSAA